MLKEFNHIARQMLFLHGHLTRPQDWTESKTGEPTTGGRRASQPAAKRVRKRSFRTAAAAYGIVTPARLIAVQLR